MAPHSSTVAWKIPWTEEPGGLQSMGSLRVGHEWATSLSLFTLMHWRRKWQPTPVFLPGESQGQRSLVGCCLWARTESDTTEETQQQQQQHTWHHTQGKPLKASPYAFPVQTRDKTQTSTWPLLLSTVSGVLVGATGMETNRLPNQNQRSKIISIWRWHDLKYRNA